MLHLYCILTAFVGLKNCLLHRVLTYGRIAALKTKRFTVGNMLDKKTIAYLRAQAHHLNPVVMVGSNGLTEAVLKELEVALVAHELVKLKVSTGEREDRQAIAQAIVEATGAELVQILGKILIFYRKREG